MVDGSTEMGGGPRPFPQTRWSVIREASDPESPQYRASLEELANLYWRPVYAHFRRKWGKANEEAKDLTQEFFAVLCEKDFLLDLNPEQGRFRSYVMVSLDNFVRLRHRKDTRQKRGGNAKHFSLEVGEGFEPTSSGSPDEDFLRDWARSILDQALLELEKEYQAEGQKKVYDLFLLRDVDPPEGEDLSYEALAKKFGIGVTDVTNYLFRARKRLREKVLSKVRDTVTNEQDLEAEMRELFEDRGP